MELKNHQCCLYFSQIAESQILPPFHSLSSILTDEDIVTGPQLLLGMLSNPNLKRTPRAWASSHEAISNENQGDISRAENAVQEYTGRLGVRNVLDNILRNISPTIETNNLLSRSTRKDSKRARNDRRHQNHSCYWNPLTCIRKRSS